MVAQKAEQQHRHPKCLRRLIDKPHIIESERCGKSRGPESLVRENPAICAIDRRVKQAAGQYFEQLLFRDAAFFPPAPFLQMVYGARISVSSR